jgi:hypothetical protein
MRATPDVKMVAPIIATTVFRAARLMLQTGNVCAGALTASTIAIATWLSGFG